MDWLLDRQAQIEDRLARRHLSDGELVLYDVSSSYFEGRSCELARLGYSRDGKRGTPQIIYGLLCDKPGRPIAVEVFSGELHDDKTLPSQIEKLKTRFGLSRIVVVSRPRDGHQGQPRAARQAPRGRVDHGAEGAADQEARPQDGALQLSLFDQANLAEITSEDYPGERLIVCRNPLVAAERARKRRGAACGDRARPGRDRRACQARHASRRRSDRAGGGPALKRYKVKKHFEVTDHRHHLHLQAQDRADRAEAALDGIYVLRTSVPDTELATGEVVRSYKNLEQVERAFSTLKGPALEIRPIHHHLEDRVRAHVFLCMLAYYLTWHLRHAWAPLLFKDEQPPDRPDPVAKATRSTAAQRKARTKTTSAGEICHSYKSLLAELGTLTRNTIRLPNTTATFHKLAQPTTTQARALDLVKHAPLDP